MRLKNLYCLMSWLLILGMTGIANAGYYNLLSDTIGVPPDIWPGKGKPLPFLGVDHKSY